MDCWKNDNLTIWNFYLTRDAEKLIDCINFQSNRVISYSLEFHLLRMVRSWSQTLIQRFSGCSSAIFTHPFLLTSRTRQGAVMWFYYHSCSICGCFIVKVYIYFHRTLTVRKHGTFGTLRRNISCLSSPSRANQKFNSTLIFPWYRWFEKRLIFIASIIIFMQVCPKSRPLHPS